MQLCFSALRASCFALSCLAVIACDSKSTVGSSDGTQNGGGDSAQTNAGSVSHAAEGGSIGKAGTSAAAGGRSGGIPTASNDTDAGMDMDTATDPAAGSGGQDGQQGGTSGRDGQAAAGGKTGAAGRSGMGGRSGAGGRPGRGGKAGQGGSAGGAGGAAEGGAGSAAGGGGAGMGPGARRCGTRGGVMCGGAEFCNFEPDIDCGGTDRGGRCESKPKDCDDTQKPVCGCDDHSYDNACDAHLAGTAVQREGLCGAEECDAAGGFIVTSDGASTPECPANEPSFRILGKEATLCCLGQDRTGKTCGGIGSLECSDSDFCNYEASAGGQGCDGRIADAAGVCQPKPGACTREYRPVCGCDHHSYGNACEAHSNGAAVLHEGECSESECGAAGGRVVVGTGPAPMCDDDENPFGPVAPAGAQIPIEGQICCVPKP